VKAAVEQEEARQGAAAWPDTQFNSRERELRSHSWQGNRNVHFLNFVSISHFRLSI
jgi:hypothetical protein